MIVERRPGPIPPPPDPFEVVITLTPDEARFLCDLMGDVSLSWPLRPSPGIIRERAKDYSPECPPMVLAVRNELYRVLHG